MCPSLLLGLKLMCAVFCIIAGYVPKLCRLFSHSFLVSSVICALFATSHVLMIVTVLFYAFHEDIEIDIGVKALHVDSRLSYLLIVLFLAVFLFLILCLFIVSRFSFFFSLLRRLPGLLTLTCTMPQMLLSSFPCYPPVQHAALSEGFLRASSAAAATACQAGDAVQFETLI